VSRLLLLLAACACAEPTNELPGEPAVEVVAEHLDEALMSVWGDDAEVWAAGADLGGGPLVLRWQNGTMEQLVTGTRGDLWWVFGIDERVYLGGAEGVIVEYRDGAFQQMATPGLATVYGIWGTAANDLWAVGGASDSVGFVWRSDGTRWTEVRVPAADSASIFKIFGRAADDVWMCGFGGITVHWDGNDFTEISAAERTLFTIHANERGALAVGGYGSGLIVEDDGSGWRDVTPGDVPALFGVVRAPGFDVVSGADRALYLREPGAAWRALPSHGLETLHATWVDPAGVIWAAGGMLAAPPFESGVVLRRGP
jgi:hypothetical protein